MRIFTLGKNGIPLFFFALILLSGAHSYGQQVDSCGVTDQNTEATGNQQYFCDSQEAELNNLLIQGADITFYSDAGYSNELDATTLLIGGTTYYIDVDGCESSVTVTIFNQPQILGVEEDALTRRPEANTKQSLGTLDICVADVENPNIFVSDLRTNAPEGSVQWYRSATATGTPQPIANPSSEELEDGVYYYAARVYEDPVDSQLNCTTNRSRTRVLLTEVEAPAADAEQEFCTSDEPTLADIVAEGNNRYYATATSQVELSQNTLLEDGETYFVSNVGVSCESSARTAVTVELQEVEAGEQVGDGIYCQSEIDTRLADTSPQQLVRELFTEQLETNVPTDGTFAGLTINEVISQYQNGVRSFTTTYTISSDLGCEDSVELSFTIQEDFYAGDDNIGTILCRSELPDTLTEETARNFFLSLISEDADVGGSFTDETIADIVTQFNSGDGIGTYTTMYSGGEGECGDSAEISVTVQPSPEPVDDISAQVCTSEFEGMSDFEAAQYFLNQLGIDPEDFSDEGFDQEELQQLIASFDPEDPAGVYSITYTQGTGECIDIATFTLTIDEPTGEVSDNSATICNADVPVLFEQVPADVREYFIALAGENAPTNGTFEPSIESLVAQYGQNNLGDFRTVYTVGEGTACEDSAELIVTITNELPADAGDDKNLTFCTSEETQDLAEFLTANANDDGTFTGDLDQIFDPATVEPGTYNVTYTVDDTSACVTEGDIDTATFTITIIESETSVADNATTICNAEVPVLFDQVPEDVREYFIALAGENAPTNGTFEPTIESLVAQYGQNNLGEFRTVYTVGEGTACEDSAELIVTITDEESEAIVEEIADLSTCTEGETITLSTLLVGDTTTGGIFTVDGTTATAFDPSIGVGTYEVTYTVNGDDLACITGTASTTFEIEVTDEESPAVVEEIADLTTCTEGETITLSTLLVGDTTTGGIFTVDGTTATAFDPSIGVGTYEVTYTVNGDDLACITGTASTTFEIEVTDEDSPAVVEEIAGLSTCTEGETITLSTLLVGDTTTGGTFTVDGTTATAFDPSIGVGTYEVTYTVNGDDLACITGTASTTFEIEVTDEESPAVVEEIADLTTCTEDETITLSTLLVGDTTTGGTFTVDGTTATAFDPSIGVGTYEVTYTVIGDDLACITGTASTTFEIEVIEGVDAGADNSTEICQSEIGEMLPNVGSVRELYLSLLEDGVSTEGTFNPTIQALADRYNSGDQFGDFTTTYTVTAGACEDSVELTVTVQEGIAPNAGADVDLAFCSTDGPQDLYEFLAEGASAEGTFADLEDGIFDPSTMEAGEYTYEYSVTTTGECGGTDTATLTITVTDAPVAPEVEDAVFCVSQGATVADLDAGANLMWYTDEALENPALAEDVLVEGPYYVTQTNEGGCESVATTITVTLDDTAAPTLAQGGNIFCEFDNPTIADLENNIVEGGDINWYDAATGGELLSTSNLLENGMTYYASLTDATSTCESSTRLAVTVTLEACELVIPEAFSPNSDGINDRFEVENLAGEYPNYNMEIFNRWGNKVFTGNSSNPSWDGTSDDGSLGDGVLPAGVYFYILNFNDGQTAPIQGRVYLSR
ncbi:gliding motility-associated C-terminal domain-containing protein [Salinimicrobium sp. GXAS 041]|uniref:gliding motility-associated C-terminal domain-containing protein n=1 Tax=Salinimicrobium sp. GXAS 041 TaxID=3400806 RepID=UPI003C77EE6E